MHADNKARLKQQFLLDPDVKESLIMYMQKQRSNQERDLPEPNTVKYDRPALNMPYEKGGIKHQNSVTVIRGSDIDRNLYS